MYTYLSIYRIQIHIHIVFTLVDNLYSSHFAPDAPMNINAHDICLYTQNIFIYTYCVYMGKQSLCLALHASMDIHAHYICLYIQHTFIYTLCVHGSTIYISRLVPDALMNINSRYICLYIQHTFIYTHCVYMGQQSLYQSSHSRCSIEYTCTLLCLCIQYKCIRTHCLYMGRRSVQQSSDSRCSYEYTFMLH